MQRLAVIEYGFIYHHLLIANKPVDDDADVNAGVCDVRSSFNLGDDNGDDASGHKNID